MTIQSVAISNTFNEFRITTNSVIDEVNKLGDGTANLVINTITANTISSSSANLSISGNLVVDTITANSYVGVSSDLTVAGNTGSDVVSLASETLNIVGTNGITTSVASNTVSVNLGSSLSLNDLTLTGGTANTLVYLNPSKQLTTLSTLSFNGTNVGINNASPAAPLDIKGSLRLTGATAGYVGLQVAASGTNTTYTLPSSDGLSGQVLQTNGTGTLSWVNQAAGGGGGGGGSGTSTARTAFTATGGQTTFSVTYAVGQVDVYMNGSKLVANNDFTATDGTSIVLAAGATAGDIVEAVSYSSQWITSGTSLYYANGSVGVGTTSPASRFHVASANTAFAVGTIRLDGANNTGVVDAPTTINAATGGGAGNGGSQLYFETRAENGSLTERVRIDHTGKVGIGTVSPATRLHIVGGLLEVENASTQDAVVIAGRAGGSSSYTATITPTTLTANRTLTLPNETGTIATQSSIASKAIAMALIFGG